MSQIVVIGALVNEVSEAGACAGWRKVHLGCSPAGSHGPQKGIWAQVVAELAAPAFESLLSDSGSPSVAVGSEERSIEGTAVSGQARGRPIVVMHMRDANESLAIEAIARR